MIGDCFAMYIQNEEGVTLLEVIASVVILTLIIVAVFSFLPQMDQMNKRNIETSQAIQLVKDELLYWQEQLQTDLDPTQVQTPIGSCPQSENLENYYCGVFPIQKEEHQDIYSVVVKVQRTPDLNNGVIFGHLLHIQLLKKENQTVASEMYGYIFLNGELQ